MQTPYHVGTTSTPRFLPNKRGQHILTAKTRSTAKRPHPVEADATTPILALPREKAALALGISTRTFDRLVARGAIPRSRLGSSIVYRVSDLREFLATLPNVPGPRPGKRGVE